MMEYYAHATSTSLILERLAELGPSMLACQHGSAYRGDGALLLAGNWPRQSTVKRLSPHINSIMTAQARRGGYGFRTPSRELGPSDGLPGGPARKPQGPASSEA